MEWTTAIAYLHLLCAEESDPIRVEDRLSERVMVAADRFYQALGHPSEPMGLGLAQISMAYRAHFIPLNENQRVKRLEDLPKLENSGIESGGMPRQDFYELIKVYHLCHLVGSPAAAQKVEQVFLRYLNFLVILGGSEETLRQAGNCSDEWWLLGNARISQDIKTIYLFRFAKTDEVRELVLQYWSNLRFE